jgi:flagellar hook capping protein FlgD
MPFGRGFIIDREGNVAKAFFGHKPQMVIQTIYSLLENDTTSTSIKMIEDSDLIQVYPNPFNPTTTLGYGLTEVSDVQLNIFNVNGHRVKQWSISNQQTGWHEVVWDGRDMNGKIVSTGVYIYSLRAGDFVDTKKMVFMK